jgi:hypothetical protein
MGQAETSTLLTAERPQVEFEGRSGNSHSEAAFDSAGAVEPLILVTRLIEIHLKGRNPDNAVTLQVETAVGADTRIDDRDGTLDQRTFYNSVLKDG